jgi:hypothetical protein
MCNHHHHQHPHTRTPTPTHLEEALQIPPLEVEAVDHAVLPCTVGIGGLGRNGGAGEVASRLFARGDGLDYLFVYRVVCVFGGWGVLEFECVERG